MPGLIEDYAVIGDLQTAALVGRDGSIDWLCLPAFDSPACFAALLHDEQAGRWQLAPAAGIGGRSRRPPESTGRRYRGQTLVLETEWVTPDGCVRLTDCMPPRGQEADVVRVVEGLTGSVPMTMDLRLRFDYGDSEPWIRSGEREWSAIAGPDAVWLHTDVPLTRADAVIRSEFTVAAGQRVPFVLSYQRSHLPTPVPVEPFAAIRETEAFWARWIDSCEYRGRWQEAVHRALILIKALTYAPTGGIVAAATTSLPERIGGVRNWDYRYCWLRDATFAIQALLGTGYCDEARDWRNWLLRAAAGDPADLRIMYGLDGRRRIPEYGLDHLAGYEGSRPVRAGNAAAHQFQLDVWGEVLDGLHQSREAGIEATDDGWDVQRALLGFLEANWQEPDNGLWEMRGPRRHFVHSKVMAWAGFDRAVTAVERFGLDGPVERWRTIRDQIHADVCCNGYDTSRNTFTQFYGSKGLDAALLLLPRVGFLPWDDPRMVGTVEAVERDLCVDGHVLRYRTQEDDNVDGLPDDEGAFLACTFWLVDALHELGHRKRATEMFERLLAIRNDVGILSEEYDPVAKRHLGNTPQAYSMVALINTARLLSGASTQTSARATEQATDARSGNRR